MRGWGSFSGVFFFLFSFFLRFEGRGVSGWGRGAGGLCLAGFGVGAGVGLAGMGWVDGGRCVACGISWRRSCRGI